LYLAHGARHASNRCDANSRLGTRDLLVELVHALRIEPQHVVVDVCCGTGQHLIKFATLASRAIGYDFSDAAVAEACRRGVEAYVADAACLPLPDGSVDALNCAFGVYYLNDLKEAIREWQRVLKPGGRIVISGPATGTNVELYEFHRQATGYGPSDADTIACGYVDGLVHTELSAGAFRDVTVDVFINPVEFPDAASFIDYWRSTSVFLRSTGADVETGVRLLARREGPFRVTKRVSIASATRTT